MDNPDITQAAGGFDKAPQSVKPRARKRRTDREVSPLQLRKRCHSRVMSAIEQGKLPRLDGSIPCTDCGAPAECYDHRNYYHALAVDPVCRGCNNRRGPGFPLNPSGNEYINESAKKLGGSAGHRWGNLEANVSKPGIANHTEKS